MEQTNIRQAASLRVFYDESENVNIRTQVINDEPWFVAKDVAMALNIDWSGKTLKAIPDDWKGMGKFPISRDLFAFDIRRKIRKPREKSTRSRTKQYFKSASFPKAILIHSEKATPASKPIERRKESECFITGM